MPNEPLNKDAKVTAAPAKPKIKIYLAYILAAVVGFYVSKAALSFFSARQKVSSPAIVQKQPKLVSVSVPQPLVKPKDKPKPNEPAETDVSRYNKKEVFVLNGIFFAKDGGYALINNQIAKVGDSVTGATVKRISQDEVELDCSGESITLSCRIR